MNLPFLKIMKLFVNGNKKSGVMAVAKMMKKNAAWLEAHPQYKAVS